ncbi:hypothetical protein TSOC_011466 [Tetrabaena socialis]|uniref:MRG domain-containing protein n=1 Tax=Tetrabaena socialis TaxID=47790 RepID=A0A2J7ZQL4_9CHLO|nr:hypothetical protein TSOC_011466 [Tetrabaena socialis]|eukprot:PNH02549.1 hypothetical protein TSOC_011466 [Tetrabaena socialis]
MGAAAACSAANRKLPRERCAAATQAVGGSKEAAQVAGSAATHTPEAEVAAGLRSYLSKALAAVLLYRSEQPQVSSGRAQVGAGRGPAGGRPPALLLLRHGAPAAPLLQLPGFLAAAGAGAMNEDVTAVAVQATVAADNTVDNTVAEEFNLSAMRRLASGVLVAAQWMRPQHLAQALRALAKLQMATRCAARRFLGALGLDSARTVFGLARLGPGLVPRSLMRPLKGRVEGPASADVSVPIPRITRDPGPLLRLLRRPWCR